MPEKGTLSLLEIERMRDLFYGILMIKRMVERDYLNDPKMVPYPGEYVTTDQSTIYKNAHNSRIYNRLTVC